ALHIFKKDVGFLRYHIALTLLAAVAFCLMGTFNIKGAGPTAFILPVTWWFLIAAVIHAEPLPGRGQFWLTRPYQRKSLLCAKALFIVTFVNIPIVVADLFIVHATGFPITANIGGFLWTQVLLLAVFEIPAAAIASITSSLLELLIATLPDPRRFGVPSRCAVDPLRVLLDRVGMGQKLLPLRSARHRGHNHCFLPIFLSGYVRDQNRGSVRAGSAVRQHGTTFMDSRVRCTNALFKGAC